ncbi:hypothetical protein [Pectobacterium phage Jarilo]|uniref:Tail assembly protein n=1 Tax=Pectobacterium phage Jarilo TaxID=2163634 RepID=A0A2S1GSZ7_9CAUD|nr:host range and adsorption protein [Pectobacterium phage Jarilo]AWD92511.1 hypothetical protein [Pectobacterium phage Jarilo]
MGFGKAFKKAFKSVTSVVTKPAAQALGAVGIGQAGATAVESQAPAAVAPAAIVETPKDASSDVSDDSQTEAGRKKARAGGKKSLSVARAAGNGLNV